MSLRVHGLCSLLMVWTAVAAAQAPSIDVETLRRRQDTQQRAREITRELVSGVLDIQLQQLEENGLSNLPIFQDVQQMRVNLDGLVEAEMATVVQLLVKAQQQVGAERETSFVQARTRIREIVVQLTVERQNLLRRLKTAELAAQVKRIIERETVVYNVTDALPSLPNSQKVAKQLTIEQDQRDVKALYAKLLETLAEVRGWGGEVGRGAGDGLAILRAAQVTENIESSLERLAGLDYVRAKQFEYNVLKGLRLLLDRVEETQGLIAADREAALERVRELFKEQEKLREHTQTVDLSSEQSAKLVDRELALQKELAKLPEALKQLPDVQPLAEKARAAAAEATDRLFNAERKSALSAQENVLASLMELERRLADDVDREQADRSATELKKEVEALEQTRAALAETSKKLDTAEAAKPDNQPQQAQPLADASKKLDERAKDEQQPRVVQARVDDAAKAVEKAAEKLKQSKLDEPVKEEARDAVDHARSVTEAALADAKRRQLAVEAGELARAAEALERASAAEQEIADKLATAKDMPPKTEDIERMAREQETINSLAEKIAEAVKESSPEAAKSVENALTEAKKAADALQAAATSDAKQAPMAAPAAKQAAADLAKAAAKLREGTVKAAEELANEASKQLGEVQPLRESTEQMVRERPKNLAEQLDQIRAMNKQVETALAEQQRAMGRKEAADAMSVAAQIAAAREKQAEADRAADEHAQGRSLTPLDAALAQERATEAIRSAAKNAAKPKSDTPEQMSLADSLAKAQQQAADAARRSLDGDEAGASQARAEARKQLADAEQKARAMAAEASKQPAQKPDAAAQARVTENAAKTGEMADEALADIRESLANAERDSRAAEQSVKAGKPQDTAKQQADAQKSLERAKQQLADAERRTVDELAKSVEKQAAQARELAKKANEVDPGAQASLDQASKAAGKMTPGEQPPAPAQPASTEPTPAARDAALASAEEQIRNAQNEQRTAAGKDEQASAKQLAEQVADSLNKQANATQAGNLARNKAGEQAEAQRKQQDATDQIERTAEQAAKRPQATAAKKQPGGDELTERLAEAKRLAADARDKLEAGQFDEAGPLQDKAQQAMQKAAEVAAREAEKALESPTKPDLAAQQRAIAAANEARKAAEKAAPDAAKQLDDAAKSGESAAKHLAANETEDARSAQDKAGESLAKAMDSVQGERKKLAEAAANKGPPMNTATASTPMPATGTPSSPMPMPTAPMSTSPMPPAASTASTPPASTPAAPSTPASPPPSAESVAAAQQQLERSLERAAAGLNEREDRILRDQALAQTMKQAAQSQQQSAAQIADARKSMSPSKPAANQPPTSAQNTAAQKLADAMQSFADAQQLVGQAAEEVSGQREIANPALRESLQIADNLSDAGPAEMTPDSPSTPQATANAADAPMPMPPPGADSKMGTQLKPGSPAATAQMMAGPQAMAQLAASQSLPDPGSRSQEQSGQQNSRQASAQSQTVSAQNAAATSATPNSDPALAGKPAGADGGDKALGIRTFREEPWVAKLPPELRAAIRAQSQRRAPAAYEERLKRYFENIE